jgi:HAD superfamily hydrolase (TIGR01484 family)
VKKVITFDLDGTLSPSKSPLPDEMGELLGQLLNHFEVCVISGGRFEQYKIQLLNGLAHLEPSQLKRLHLMPTCGTQYYQYDDNKNDWHRIYAELLEEDEKARIADALNKGFDDLGYRADKTYGEIIEDRGSQMTYSVLGQDIVKDLGEEGLRLKHEWDPDDSKKNQLRDYIAPLIPEFEVRVGGVTSIDVTKPGIDKAYGMQKIIEILGVAKADILFIGDRVRPGGNDYPVKEMGIDCIEITGWEDTTRVITGILHVV